MKGMSEEGQGGREEGRGDGGKGDGEREGGKEGRQDGELQLRCQKCVHFNNYRPTVWGSHMSKIKRGSLTQLLATFVKWNSNHYILFYLYCQLGCQEANMMPRSFSSTHYSRLLN